MRRELLLLLVALLSIVANAQDPVEIDGIWYNLIPKAKIAEVTSKPSGSYSGEVVIPASFTYDGKEFSVTIIGESAFRNCRGLTSVTIPNSVTSIGGGAFYNCGGLTSVHITDLAAWCNIAFGYSSSNPLYYAHHLYMNGEEIKDLVIPNSVTSIGEKAFYYCSGLTSVTIPNSVTSIGNSAFAYCSGLTSITIPNSVTSIGEYAFSGCPGLTSVTIGNSVTSIGSYAFSGCSGLTSVTIPNSVTSIGGGAFNGCSGLTSITIPNSVTSIGGSAFYGCTGLTSIAIGNSVTSIGSEAFSGCSGLTSITIPNSVTSIGESAFYGCTGLTSVTIPNSVTSIGRKAFDGCSGLTSVTIPNSVTSIGSEAFSGCSGLTSITIGNGVTSIGYNAFDDCSKLTSVHITDVAAWCNIAFGGSNPLSYAHHLYMNGEEIKDLVIPNSVTSISNWAFDGCRGLTSVTIPNSVTSISDYAFRDCSSLTSVTIGNSVTSIGEWAFSNCSSLTSVTIPNSVTSIGDCAFRGCSGLTSVTIGSGVTSIYDYAFSGCSGLTSVTIPNSVTSIGRDAFEGCNGLTSVTIGSGMKSIGSRAFAECPELTDVYCYAEQVPGTGSDAFEDSYIEYATLHVPAASIELYKAKKPWSLFGTKKATDGSTPEPPTPEKCATPTISYAGGKLTFTSTTEGAECVATITDADVKTHYGNEVSLSATYVITVYATKAGCDNSEAATATLCWIDRQPVTNGIIAEDAVNEVKALPVLIQAQAGTITVSGLDAGTEVSAYNTSGMLLDTIVSGQDTTTLRTNLTSGSTAIVKIGDKAIKVMVK